MNIHHLELFYYVAKYEGISAAVKKMPYQIQQPAVSSQVLQLEKDLGVSLFHRRPFELTREGEKLYDFAYPFFSKLDEVEASLRGGDSVTLVLGASATVARMHMPEVLLRLQEEVPGLKLQVKDVPLQEVPVQLKRGEIDVFVGPVHPYEASSSEIAPLMKLSLCFLVPENHPAQRDSQIWDLLKKESGKLGSNALITLKQSEVIRDLFEEGLLTQGLQWQPDFETSSLEVVEEYVLRGFGVGVSVIVPGMTLPEGLRSLPLSRFPKLIIAGVYQGEMKPLVKRFLRIGTKVAKEIKV